MMMQRERFDLASVQRKGDSVPSTPKPKLAKQHCTRLRRIARVSCPRHFGARNSQPVADSVLARHKEVTMGTKHGQLMRGMEAAGKSDQTFKSFKTFKSFDGIFGARFGRLFPKSTAGQFKHDALVKLANHMVSPFDPPKDGPDAEEGGIPALYTYFGQFIDHDLTFDPATSFQKHKDPNATEDFRTPSFDLDNLYGRGPGDQPYLYQDDGISFLLGDRITQGSNDGARALPRNVRGRA